MFKPTKTDLILVAQSITDLTSHNFYINEAYGRYQLTKQYRDTTGTVSISPYGTKAETFAFCTAFLAGYHFAKGEN